MSAPNSLLGLSCATEGRQNIDTNNVIIYLFILIVFIGTKIHTFFQLTKDLLRKQ